MCALQIFIIIIIINLRKINIKLLPDIVAGESETHASMSLMYDASRVSQCIEQGCQCFFITSAIKISIPYVQCILVFSL